jgi:exopolysaccharide biosynthesis polyprenyl glycosylphosphotransferase
MGFGSQRQSKHLRWAGLLFLADFGIIWISFLCGIWVRFESFFVEKLLSYGSGIGVASIVFPSLLYIGGLYSSRNLSQGWLVHSRWLVFGFLAVGVCILVTGSLDFSSRVGRGVLLAASPLLVVLVLLRHWFTIRRKQKRMDSVMCLVTSEADERAAQKLHEFWGDRAKRFGLVSAAGYHPGSSLPVIGSIEALGGGDQDLSVDVVLVRDSHFTDATTATFLRSLRYDGTDIVPLADACEDAYHAVPLELITDAWLFRASNQSQLFYIRKLKRLSDVILSFLFLILLAPFLALGMLIVRLASPGPVIFRQARVGRFGRSITIFKLRTMHVEVESGKARWATDETNRIFPLGQILRKFRIDEIPQLINVMKGDMSFVGPRPEQISIVDDLSEVIPFYRERLLIQPGITGWAQVNYPYGASVADAARKLEYDLYYLKHMGIFFDLFILLETVKIILCGGVRKGGDIDYLHFRADMVSLEEELKSIRGQG